MVDGSCFYRAPDLSEMTHVLLKLFGWRMPSGPFRRRRLMENRVYLLPRAPKTQGVDAGE